jgi:hypothetical protein
MVKIISDFAGDTPDAMATTMDLERFSSDDKKEIIFYGIHCTLNRDLQELYKDYERKVLIDLWSPCQFNGLQQPGNIDAHKMVDYFDEVYSICPYTVKWMNEVNGYDKMRDIKSPFNKKLVPEPKEKEYDVCYTGSIHSQEFADLVNTISEFNYRFISKGVTQGDFSIDKITDLRVSTPEKMNIVAKSKIGVAINLLYLTPDQVNHFLSYPRINENEMYEGVLKDSHTESFWTRAPQFKIRIHEYAVSKTLILCKRDSWNVIERYYVPDEDFLYFEDMQDLRSKIYDILGDWDRYQSMIENAYEKVNKYYMTDKVIQDVIKGNVE